MVQWLRYCALCWFSCVSVVTPLCLDCFQPEVFPTASCYLAQARLRIDGRVKWAEEKKKSFACFLLSWHWHWLLVFYFVWICFFFFFFSSIIFLLLAREWRTREKEAHLTSWLNVWHVVPRNDAAWDGRHALRLACRREINNVVSLLFS